MRRALVWLAGLLIVFGAFGALVSVWLAVGLVVAGGVVGWLALNA